MVKYDYSYQLGAAQGSSSRATNQYIILHDTGNANNTGNNSAKNEASYMRSHWQDAYTHAIAGWDRVYIIGEPGYVAYGAGSPANERSPFQIELARYADHSKAIAAYKNWIEAAVGYTKKFGIPLTLDGAGNGIKSHKWVSDNLWGDHQDPYAYLASIGISKAQLAADLKNGTGSTPSGTTPASTTAKPSATKSVPKVNVHYGLRQLGGAWLGEITNAGSGSTGFAGLPNHKHDLLYAKVDHGTLKYRTHTLGGGWEAWVSKGNKADTVTGCAGVPGKVIDGVEIIYITPSGEEYHQAWYRSQTVARSGWLGTVCDDGGSVTGYSDSYAGVLGEALDRLQISIGTNNPY